MYFIQQEGLSVAIQKIIMSQRLLSCASTISPGSRCPLALQICAETGGNCKVQKIVSRIVNRFTQKWQNIKIKISEKDDFLEDFLFCFPAPRENSGRGMLCSIFYKTEKNLINSTEQKNLKILLWKIVKNLLNFVKLILHYSLFNETQQFKYCT